MVFYASPVRSARDSLWDMLHRKANVIDGLWMIGGDFNYILHSLGKKVVL